MTAKILSLDTDYLIREYTAGRNAQSLANECGVSVQTIKRRLAKHGVKMWDGRGIRLPDSDIVRRYVAGESEKALADAFGCARHAIRKRLKDAGATVRGCSEAQRLGWKQKTPAQRIKQYESAHKSTRGRHVSFEEKCKRAATREARRVGISYLERALDSMLTNRGIVTMPQKAIGPYNCDLAAFPVAMEVFGGHWHFSGRHLARTEERFRYLMDQGWHILVIVHSGQTPMTEATADYVAAYIEAARADHAAVREYRMIRGAGQVLASGCADDDDFSIEPAFTSVRDAMGRYRSVPR